MSGELKIELDDSGESQRVTGVINLNNVQAHRTAETNYLEQLTELVDEFEHRNPDIGVISYGSRLRQIAREARESAVEPDLREDKLREDLQKQFRGFDYMQLIKSYAKQVESLALRVRNIQAGIHMGTTYKIEDGKAIPKEMNEAASHLYDELLPLATAKAVLDGNIKYARQVAVHIFEQPAEPLQRLEEKLAEIEII